ncbi:FG-GAP repeat domain-containing protein [Roseicella aerolata]|uniref:VCBS repeat-containing protein n=1 Tax=Roseicella aerolata TaxID=2883479 RepID=A0A9X1IE84_9PROT|nr:VCBS repeat-containing protein [Roseicella aerolata]MCB4822108.1 VCBS repeat-containing protein [Roseicella aerolata]
MPVFLALNNYGRSAGGWTSYNTYPRELGDVNGDGRQDIVGFGEAGVYVSLGRTDGTFTAPNLVLRNFAPGAGGWSTNDRYPREIGDVNGDGRDDIVGFGDAGVYVALGRANGTFGDVRFVLANFGYNAGGWTSDNTYPRELGDVNGDGREDIIGFGQAGVYVALARADGSFGAANLVLRNFAPGAGGWTDFNTYPRQVGDVNGDGRDDIVGFGEAGVYVALGRANGTFGDPNLVLSAFGRSAAAGGWTSHELYPRVVEDIDGDGRDDIVGFGEAGVYVALAKANGTFENPTFEIPNFARGAGGWTNFNTYPRDAGDVNGDGRGDIVGFGDAGVYVALGHVSVDFL